MIGLALVASIVCRIRQDTHLEYGDGLHFFVESGETSLSEVEVAALFDQALQLDGASPIGIALAEIDEGLLDRFAIFPGRFALRFRLIPKIDRFKQVQCYFQVSFGAKKRT